MSPLDVLWITLFTLSAAFGSYAYKLAARRINKRIITNWYIYVGACLYLCSNIFFILALKGNKLSIILGFTGLNYVWSLAIARLLLKEKLHRSKVIAISLIILGVIVINL